MSLCNLTSFATLTGLNGVEEVAALPRLADVRVDEQRIGFGVDVLNHDLEAVEASCLWLLDFVAEPLQKVLVDDTVRGSEECEDVRHEEALVIIEAVVPIVKILGEINLFCGPEGCFGLLVHVPNLNA